MAGRGDGDDHVVEQAVAIVVPVVADLLRARVDGLIGVVTVLRGGKTVPILIDPHTLAVHAVRPHRAHQSARPAVGSVGLKIEALVDRAVAIVVLQVAGLRRSGEDALVVVVAVLGRAEAILVGVHAAIIAVLGSLARIASSVPAEDLPAVRHSVLVRVRKVQASRDDRLEGRHPALEVRASLGAGHRLRSPAEEPREHEDGVADVPLPVAVHVAAFRCHRIDPGDRLLPEPAGKERRIEEKTHDDQPSNHVQLLPSSWTPARYWAFCAARAYRGSAVMVEALPVSERLSFGRFDPAPVPDIPHCNRRRLPRREAMPWNDQRSTDVVRPCRPPSRRARSGRSLQTTMRENPAGPLTRGEGSGFLGADLFAVEPDPVQVRRLRVKNAERRGSLGRAPATSQSAWLVAEELDPGF